MQVGLNTFSLQRLFKLSDTDTKSTDLATERENLDFILKASVPGLVSSNTQNAAKASENDRLPDKSATGHKLLVEPSVFNMGVLLPPSLNFLTRLKEVVPPNSDVVLSTLTSFLDEFLINVFYPQLEETLAELSSTASAQLDAFRQDPKWQSRAGKPIFKVTIHPSVQSKNTIHLTVIRELLSSSNWSRRFVRC